MLTVIIMELLQLTLLFIKISDPCVIVIDRNKVIFMKRPVYIRVYHTIKYFFRFWYFIH